MVAFHVQRGILVPLSAAEFYAGLDQRFPPRDGMYFLPDQAVEYDKKHMKADKVQQLALMPRDENSAILWLLKQLSRKPQTFQELQPQFMKDAQAWLKFEKPMELSDLLSDNFLLFDGKGPIPGQIVSWLRLSETHRPKVRAVEAKGAPTNLGLETTDAGLIIRELKLRGLVKQILIVVPRELVAQWISEMQPKFHEKFKLILPEEVDSYNQRRYRSLIDAG